MSRSGPKAPPQTGSGTYFFLSYAHSAPTSQGVDSDTDPWVSVLYHDLGAEVRRIARPSAGLDIGFFDGLLPPGSDWKAMLTNALGSAEVFVPLYSPGYLNKSWPMGERESFRRRLAATTAADAGHRHVIPVLWIPLPASERGPELDEALELGTGIPDYADNGLRALCMLSSYREHYLTILRRLARRIVEVAERSPLGPSRAPALEEIATPPPTETPFLVGVFAPTRADLPPDRGSGAYGASAARWRPFGGAHAVPVAQYAANVAERLGLPTMIVDMVADRHLFDTCPGVILVDPWITTGSGSPALATMVADLREWVTLLVVTDHNDPQYADRGALLSDDVIGLLNGARPGRARQVRELDEFVQLMPALVTGARRQYLRHAPVFPPKGPTSRRPRLTGHNAPPSPTQEEDR